MNQAAKLQPGQLTMILTLSSAFSVMCAAFPFTLEQMIGTVISFAIQLLSCIPVLRLTRKPNGLAMVSKDRKILPLLFCEAFLLSGGRSVVQLWNVSENLALPVNNAILAAALIAIVCLYTSSLGIQTLARSSTLIFGILLLTLVMMLLGGYRSIHLENLSFSPDASIWNSTIQQLSLAEELPVLVLLVCFLKKQPIKSTLRYLGLSFCIWSFVSFLGITILGSFMKQADYPFFTIASVSQPFQTQRSDALYLIVFVLLCILRLTLFTTLSAHLLGQVFSKLHFRNGICLLVLLIHAAVIGIWNLESEWWYLIPILGLTVLVPWGLLGRSEQKVAK